MGMGERGFPRLNAPEPFFDEAERQALRQAGLDISCMSDLMAEEMLLFYQIVTRAQRRLVLSYPAVDERGQALLPSSFLSAVLDCFDSGTVPVERRSMLIEGYDRDEPLAPAEYRVQLAMSFSRDPKGSADPISFSRDPKRSADSISFSRDPKGSADPISFSRDPKGSAAPRSPSGRG